MPTLLGASVRIQMPDPSNYSSLRQPLISSDEENSHKDALAISCSCRGDGDHEDSRTQHAENNNEGHLSPRDSQDAMPQELNNVVANRMGKRNIRLTLWYASIAFAGRSIWNQSVLSAFVYLIQHEDPKAVGFLTGVMGISQLLASFPTGYIADLYPRDNLLKFATLLGLSAVSATIAVCWLEVNYVFLVMALSLWGVYYGVANTSIMALFADSIEDGQRCHYFTQRSIRVMMGNMMGPVCALGMFRVLGDHWSVHDCAVVMTLGQIICAPAVILLCFFHDGQRRGNLVSNRSDDREIENGATNTADPDVSLNSMQTRLLDELNDDGSSDEEDGARLSENMPSANLQGTRPFWWISWNHQRTIPILIAFSDVMSGLGSGLSIRYFPLFFMHNLGFSPVQVQIIYICCTVSQVVLAKTSQRLADRYFGRCRTTVAFKWVGILFMAAMILTHLRRAPRYVVGLLFVLRTGFMNSCGALTRSLLMDNVPSNERGKWSALESVNMFSWSGSAAIGGILVKGLGISPLFAITASIQLLSSLMVLSLSHVDTMPLAIRRSG